jgi:hypothetical protein
MISTCNRLDLGKNTRALTAYAQKPPGTLLQTFKSAPHAAPELLPNQIDNLKQQQQLLLELRVNCLQSCKPARGSEISGSLTTKILILPIHPLAILLPNPHVGPPT